MGDHTDYGSYFPTRRTQADTRRTRRPTLPFSLLCKLYTIFFLTLGSGEWGRRGYHHSMMMMKKLTKEIYFD
jgi:hypothetical protein